MCFENETNLSLCQKKKKSVVWGSSYASSGKVYVSTLQYQIESERGKLAW